MNLRALARWLALPVLLASITFGWWIVYHDSFQAGLPAAYQGDALMMMTRILGYATGESSPFQPQMLSRLNAPFAAAWSDYPVEDMVYFPAGILAKWLGLVRSTTVYLLLLQLAAGVTCYFAALLVGVRRDYAMAAGILFGLAPYGFQSGFTHLNLTVFWYVPLLVAVLVWAGWPERTLMTWRQGLVLAITTALIGGLLCPYYLAPFLLNLGFIVLGQIAGRDWNAVRRGILVFGAAFCGLVLQNVDTLAFAMEHGANAKAIGRDYWGLVKFGLYLPDLLFPSAHRLPLVQGLSRELYQSRVPTALLGESQTAYIGIVSLFGMAWLMLSGVIRISARQYEEVSPYFWLTLGVFAFAVVGGLNYLLGAFGFLLLRATNRVSIVLSAMALMFLANRVRHTRLGRLPLVVPIGMIAVGMYDQIPNFPVWQQSLNAKAWADYRSDSDFFKQMEQRLPARAMVFQLPVKTFPESDTIREMGDYEHFRPLLHTQTLRFSYGTVKGRGDADWQDAVAAQPPSEMLATLERYGFAAILINRKAYADRAESLSQDIIAGGAALLAQDEDFLVFRLAPTQAPELPPILHPVTLSYGSGFHAPERNRREEWMWARAEAEIRIQPAYRPAPYPAESAPVMTRLSFDIEPVRADREILIAVDGQPERTILAAGQTRARVEVKSAVGRQPVIIRFRSTRMSSLPSSDWRWLNFRVINPQIETLSEPSARLLPNP